MGSQHPKLDKARSSIGKKDNCFSNSREGFDSPTGYLRSNFYDVCFIFS